MMQHDAFTFRNRVLFLCDDAPTLKRQLAGSALVDLPPDLCDNVSTDEITPAWTCYWYDATLGRYCLVGLRNHAIGEGDLRNLAPEILVAGSSFGCGSSRETAPYALKAAGVRLVLARSFEKIFHQNAENIGLLTTNDFGLLPRLLGGDAVALTTFADGRNTISQEVVLAGGLSAYNRARLQGRVTPITPETAPGPMTAIEKIIAAHAVRDAERGLVGLPAVRPGDALFCRADIRFTHDYVTAMAASLFTEGFGADARVQQNTSCYAFRDHLNFLAQTMPAERRAQGLLRLADDLATVQERFCHTQGIELCGVGADGGSNSICHNAVLETLAVPGQLVIGTDSHTCTAGALGCFAFGVGATDMANAWMTRDVRVTVPATVRVILTGALNAFVVAKDVMLKLLAMPYIQTGHAIGKVLEFTGTGLKSLSLDERATLTNMAVEAGATTGFVAADGITLDTLALWRSEKRVTLARRVVTSDAAAAVDHTLEIDLTTITPMVAEPGDPRRGVPLQELHQRVAIDIAYGGSCTGGKRADMDMYAAVLGAALARGQHVHPRVAMYIQFGSATVRAYADARGYLELFRQAGATLIEPSCGACINAGPGVSQRAEQVTVSAINRNFPGRSGPGRVYLASPYVVAASALTGYLAAPNLDATPTTAVPPPTPSSP